jgi:tetratricopeptide (TPR) repeat protein
MLNGSRWSIWILASVALYGSGSAVAHCLQKEMARVSVGHLGTSFMKVDVAATAFSATHVESVLQVSLPVSFYAPVRLSLPRQHETEQSGAQSRSGLNSVDGLIAQGERFERLQRDVDAEMAYRSAYALEPDSIDAVTHLASVLEREQQTAAAITYWKKAIVLRPGEWSLQSSLAAAYLDDKQTAVAISALEKLLAQHPESAVDLINLGAALARSSRYPEAVTVYRRAMAIPEIADTATFSLIKSLITLAHYSEAVPLGEHYRDLHPKDYEAHSLLGLIYRSLGQTQQAEHELRTALSLREDDFDSQYNLGVVLREEGQEQEAILHLQKAVSLKPGDSGAHFQLARAYRTEHMTTRALQEEQIVRSNEQARSVDTQTEVLGNQALQAIAQQNLGQAITFYKEILTLAPRNAEAHYNLALIYERENDRADERRTLEEAERIANPLAAIHNQLGFLDMAEGQTETAKAQFATALAQDPQCVQALGNLAVLSARVGKLEDAARMLDLAVETDPGYEKGFLNLGLVLGLAGDDRQATTALERALALAPQDAAAVSALRQLKRDQQEKADLQSQ